MGRIIMWFILLLIYPIFAQELPIVSFSSTGDFSTFLVNPNQSIEIPIFILNVNNLSYIDIILEYNRSIVYPEKILNGDFNITYEILEEDKILFLSNTTNFSGDLLLARIVFKAIGPLGKKSNLILIVNEIRDTNYENMYYQVSEGIIKIGSKSKSGTKLDPSLENLINVENKTKYAKENNLNVTNGKVKVKIITDSEEEIKFVNITELKNLTKNQSIKKIEPYREFHWETYILPIIILFIITILILLYRSLK